MANRNYPASRQFSFHLLPVRLDGKITIGSSGAVSAITGKGIKTATKQGTGVYRIQLEDNYASFLKLNAHMQSTNSTGAAADPHGLTVGTLYIVTTVGNTDWNTAGIPTGITPAVGQVFALAAQPAAGTGRCKAYVPSNISNIQVAGNPNNGFMSKQPFTATNGGYITIVTQAATDASTTTLIPTSPNSGDEICFEIYLNNSAVQ